MEEYISSDLVDLEFTYSGYVSSDLVDLTFVKDARASDLVDLEFTLSNQNIYELFAIIKVK